jgi:hypothetical protein
MTVANRTKAAVSGADITQQQKGCGSQGEARPLIRAPGTFTHRVQVHTLQDILGLEINGGVMGALPDPACVLFYHPVSM